MNRRDDAILTTIATRHMPSIGLPGRLMGTTDREAEEIGEAV